MATRVLSTAISRHQLLLAAGDVICIALALFCSNLVYVGYQLGWRIYEHLLLLATPSLFIIVVHMAFFYFADVYDLKQDLRSMRYFTNIVLAVGLSLLFMGLCFFLFPKLRYGRAVTFIHALFLIMFVIAWRFIFMRVTKRLSPKNVLIVGMDKSTADIARELNASHQSEYRLVGCVLDNESSQEMPPEWVRVVGGPDALAAVVRQHNIQEIIVASSAEKNGQLVKTLIHLGYEGIMVNDAVSFYERLTGKIPFSHLTDIWLLTQSMGQGRFFQGRLKRLMDIILSAIGLVIGAIPLAIAALAIKITSPGPVFYRQERLGRNGVPFTLIKLRTMVPNAESQTGAVYATTDDPRITRVGRFLRRTRLDEIPQLWNVLKGDMSLVGPRPERPEFVAQFEKSIPYYRERLMVRPGLTGWAQVNYPYAATLQETMEKLQYDLYYVKNMSILLDLLILLKTVKTVMFAKGR